MTELPSACAIGMFSGNILGHHTAECGLTRDGTPDQLGRELDELGEALGLDETP